MKCNEKSQTFCIICLCWIFNLFQIMIERFFSFLDFFCTNQIYSNFESIYSTRMTVSFRWSLNINLLFTRTIFCTPIVLGFFQKRLELTLLKIIKFIKNDVFQFNNVYLFIFIFISIIYDLFKMLIIYYL